MKMKTEYQTGPVQTVHRPLSELNVIDNFLFTELMNDPEHRIEFAELLLGTILNKKVSVITVVAQQVIGGTDADKHGIRLDAYIEPESEGTEKTVIYDIEAETRQNDKNTLTARNRYYSTMMDGRLLGSGKSYEELPDLMTIFILSYDPFDAGRMIYEARTCIIGHPEIPYDDGIRRLYLYTDGEIDDSLGEQGASLRNLLQYVRHSTRDHAVDETTKRMDHIVRSMKKRKEVNIAYMKQWEYERILRKEAIEEGLAEGREKGLAEGREKGLLEGREKGLAEGLEQGLEQGRASLNALYGWLLENGRMEDMKRCIRDNSYCDQMLEEMSISTHPDR